GRRAPCRRPRPFPRRSSPPIRFLLEAGASSISSGMNRTTGTARFCSGSSVVRPLRRAPDLPLKSLTTSIRIAINLAPAMNLGLIGLDTSHAVHFATLFHDPSHPGHQPGFRIVAAYPGGSERLPRSYAQVQDFSAKLR